MCSNAQILDYDGVFLFADPGRGNHQDFEDVFEDLAPAGKFIIKIYESVEVKTDFGTIPKTIFIMGYRKRNALTERLDEILSGTVERYN